MSKTLTLTGECASIAARLQKALAEQGHWVVNSFDLQSARALTPESCPCPHHHTTQCTCQYIVLIVYVAQGGPPRAITLHEFEGITRATLDDPDGMLAALLAHLQEKSNHPTEQEQLEM
jgi:hypothetical protein